MKGKRVYEFEGKTEKEAIEQASKVLGLDYSQFEVQSQVIPANGLFRKNKVKIQVYTNSDHPEETELEDEPPSLPAHTPSIEELSDWERQIIDFTEKIFQYMELPGKVILKSRDQDDLLFSVTKTNQPSLVIGKNGKNLESFQVLLNAYLGRLRELNPAIPPETRIQLDIKNYWQNRREKLIRTARKIAQKVEAGRNSYLLEAMNPADRRIIHIALQDCENVVTTSEGDGIYKQVRILYKGPGNP